MRQTVGIGEVRRGSPSLGLASESSTPSSPLIISCLCTFLNLASSPTTWRYCDVGYYYNSAAITCAICGTVGQTSFDPCRISHDHVKDMVSAALFGANGPSPLRSRPFATMSPSYHVAAADGARSHQPQPLCQYTENISGARNMIRPEALFLRADPSPLVLGGMAYGTVFDRSDANS